jgi:hypothetical protein
MVVVAVAFASSLLRNVLEWLCLCLNRDQRLCACRTFAVAYELGLSRRSIVLRRGGIMHDQQQ